VPLREVNEIETKILTAEDPVEYEIEGIMQVPVNHQVGLDFARALRAFLRQDPDKIMVGEIRDIETARIAVQASVDRTCRSQHPPYQRRSRCNYPFDRYGA
jgi:type IV pilus assembly protein PilB